MEEATHAQPVATGRSHATTEVTGPERILCELAPAIVPVLYEVAEHTWPAIREVERHKWGPVGPMVRVRENLPERYKVLLRKNDLGTLDVAWRLEAGGPVEFFDWEHPGRIAGQYGIRYPVYTVYPVYEHGDAPCGFTINAKAPVGNQVGKLSAVEARVDSQVFVRSTAAQAVIEALRSVQGQPRVEEYRPGLSPTDAYFDLISHANRQAYFETRGINQYVGPGWSPGSLEQAFDDPRVRALWIGHPERPSATPEPEAH